MSLNADLYARNQINQTPIDVASSKSTRHLMITFRDAQWSVSNHHSRPESIKQAVTSMMMIRSLQPSSVLHQMPIEMMFEIFAAIQAPPPKPRNMFAQHGFGGMPPPSIAFAPPTTGGAFTFEMPRSFFGGGGGGAPKEPASAE